MTEWEEQQICIKLCIKLEHSSTETIWMIQKPAAMGNWWLAASSLTTHLLIHHASCRVFWWNIKSPRWLIAPPTAQIWHQQLLAFPKLKLPLKGKRFQTISKIQENTTGKLMAIGKTAWVPKVPTLKGTEVSLPYVQCFLYLLSSSINVSIFHIT